MNELVFLKHNQAEAIMPKVRDRNGRAIKLGDRVRIIAEECNKFLHDWYGEAWIPDMHAEEDEFGTVAIQDGFAQIVNEHGDMLADLTLYDGEAEPSFEIVDCDATTIGNNHCIKATSCNSVSDKETPSVLPLNEALIAWFGEEGGRRMADAFAAYEPPKKCVYILRLNNGTIKIGVTKNFLQRMNTVSNSSGLEVVGWCHTDYLPQRDAYTIESSCHKIFGKQRIKGEFFSTSYETCRSELQNQLAKHFLTDATIFES